MHGKGLYIWADQTRYEGSWFNGERSGEGMMTLPNGERHTGTYSKNKKNGLAWWRFTSGKVRQGEWQDDTLVRWLGPEMFEAQMKAKQIKARKTMLK
jgi:hypothetical protein